MKKLFTILLFSFSLHTAFAQDQTTDSLRIYRKVEEKAKKKKITYWLYKEIFNLPNQNKKKETQRKQVNYQNLKGRIIREVIVETYDPFGFSVQDTSKHPKGVVQKGGNILHLRTKRRAIINQLLFKAGDKLDPLKVKESERILRQSRQIKEVAIFIVPVKGTRDSVDVIVREQDYWSKSFAVGVSPVKSIFNFSDINFFGLAHHFDNDITYYTDSNEFIISGSYTIPYIGNTLIVPTIQYSSDPDDFSRGVGISRPFISPLIKWAGSIDLYDNKSSGVQYLANDVKFNYATRYFSKDFWLARSFKLSNDTSEEKRSTQLIVGARYRITDFNYFPPENVSDPYNFQNTHLYLLGFGYTNRTFYREYYLYRFGVQEDVPTGRILTLTGGYEVKNSGNRWYAGIDGGAGNHFDNLGYLNMHASYGTYIHNEKHEQGVVNLSLGYFSDLIEFKRTRFRQFVKMGMTFGFHRRPDENLTLNGSIKGLNSDELTGRKRAVMILQTQAYLPYQILGFRFAPFIFINLGFIAEDGRPFSKSKLYQGYGLGLLVKNELLTLKNIQVSFGIYPFIPGRANAIFKYNPLRNSDFTFEDFQVQRPSPIGYN